MKRKIVWRTALVLGLAVVLLGLLAPYLSANQFRERIREALQAALHRKVEIGEVHYNLFTGPGFSVEDVLIGDEAGAGIEPFAHVESLKARLQLKSLFTWHLAFSKLRLLDPSVNLVKTDAGPWNVQAFFQRAASEKEHGPHASFPDIEIVDGRINFKFGLIKSVFYINHADLDIYPNSSGDLVVSFLGEPARTDRGAQGFGRLSGRGLLHNSGRPEDELTMAVQLDRSSLSELVRLFSARDFGIHGQVASNATLSGPLSHIAITGSLNVSGIHRWDLMPAQGEGWTLKYRGVLDVHSQKLDLETSAAPEEKIPVALKFRAADFISAPKWAASMILKDLPAASLVETARHLGAALPNGVQVDGKVSGGLGFSNPGGVQGELAVANASFKFPDSGSAAIDAADIVINNQQVSLAPAELILDNGHAAAIEARFDAGAQTFVMQIATKLLTAADLKSGPGSLVDAASIPVLAGCRQGTWDGKVRYERKGQAAGEWSGIFDVQNAQLDLPGMAAPLRVISAGVEIESGKVQVKNLRGRVGAVPIQADYRYELSGGTHLVHLTASEADLADLERLFMPTLRREQGFLANLRLRQAALPDWLKDRDVEGTVQIKRLMLAEAPLCAFKAHLKWTGTDAQLMNAACVQDDMEAAGRVAVNLAGSSPQYRLSGQVRNLDYHEGLLGFEGRFDTAGTGTRLLLNATSQGAFTGRDIQFASDTTLREISGTYQLSTGAAGPRLLLTRIQASDGADTFTGQGASLTDGRVVLDLMSAARRQVKLSGSLLPLHSPPSEPRP